MKSSDPNPKLPAWIFIATDLALIGAAVAIAAASPQPLPSSAVVWIVACVGLGAIVGLVPLVVIYEQRKNELLDERQSALEALARTVSSSAEQVSIAANGLHQIAELALKNLRMAEHLPHKLQEKIAEFQAGLAAANDADREELERELLSLRTSESERLESVSQRIAKTTAEWVKLEAAVRQQLAAAQEASSRIGAGLSGAIDKAQSAAEQALTRARIDAARSLGEASGEAVRAVEAARAAALADLEARITAAAALVVERVTAELRTRVASTATASPAAPALPPSPVESRSGSPSAPEEAAPPSPTPAPAPSAAGDAGPAEATVAAPKRPRRPRRSDATPVASAAPAGTASPAEEPPPVPAEAIPEVAPVAPATTEPFAERLAAAPVPPAPSAADESVAPAPRRRGGQADAAAADPGLGLDLEESSGASVAEGVLTSDGATRLLVTAYIGIGNRLFIRGQGPGLSWEKGIPLQFVSIGKWRWETSDAGTPVRFKLYKNDLVECAALGEQAIEPGHQQEVTAAF